LGDKLLHGELLAMAASIPPMLFPYLFLTLLGISGLLLLIGKLCQEVDEPIDPLAAGKRPALHAFAMVILATLGFIYAAPAAGFVLVAAAVLLLVARSLGARWLTSLMLAFTVPAVLYQLFAHHFGVKLPPGWFAW
jgi:hypothetical protein